MNEPLKWPNIVGWTCPCPHLNHSTFYIFLSTCWSSLAWLSQFFFVFCLMLYFFHVSSLFPVPNPSPAWIASTIGTGPWQGPSYPACMSAYYGPGAMLSALHTFYLIHRTIHGWYLPTATLRAPSDQAFSLRPRKGMLFLTFALNVGLTDCPTLALLPTVPLRCLHEKPPRV